MNKSDKIFIAGASGMAATYAPFNAVRDVSKAQGISTVAANAGLGRRR